jgi:predicted enzyme related to lactoylglutathione lyase
MASKKKATKTKTKSKKAAKPAKKKAVAKARVPMVVHWEVQARDPGRQQRFFSDLFGWKIDADNPMNYGMVASAGKEGIDGGIGPTEDASRVTVYVQVADIQQVLSRAESLGAQTIMPRTDIGMVIMAQFRDPEGNVIGVIEG